ncbi:hypothetical protein AAAT88_09295 [Dialister hominis]
MHLGIRIRQYNRKHDFEAFFYYPNEIAILLEKIHKSYEEFLAVESQVPPVVLHQFSLLSILDEVKSTNDIEGVRSTRKRNKRNHRWRSTEIGPAGKHRQ